ncbi:glutathione hydrolase 3-like, partial [Gigantopelta aegis]|uniref:glutathione hydrolase 3-like n=1 Tax=Gigantopelta aegis TaxID=1735272 RepID=UPI001B88A009
MTIIEIVILFTRNDSHSDDETIKSDYQHGAVASGLAIGVPGQVKGLYAAHQKFGRLSWAELVQPSIELAEKGYLQTGINLRAEAYHRIVEAFKFGYAQRTTHLCVLDEQGDGVAITSTINS